MKEVRDKMETAQMKKLSERMEAISLTEGTRKYRPDSLAIDVRDRKVKWLMPKRAIVVATLVSDVHFRRLRRWIFNHEDLEMITGQHNELMIVNKEVLARHKARKA